jgi:hypothetical protein
MCHAVQLMETAADSFATSSSSSALLQQQPQQPQQQYETSSPVPLVLALANAGRRVFEPQRVISDYHSHADILRFASPSNAFIKTYGIIVIIV